ncbi:MAG: hypothetical protein ACW99Q_27240, partial [Candidatus Kariarchaeaceae archaeon]
MDPITAVLIATGTGSLSTYLKNKLQDKATDTVGKKFLQKVQSKKVGQLTIEEFQTIVTEIIEEIDIYSDEETRLIVDGVMDDVGNTLHSIENNIINLTASIDSSFNGVMLQMEQVLAKQFLDIKTELSSSIILNKEGQTQILEMVQQYSNQMVSKHTNFQDACKDLLDEYCGVKPSKVYGEFIPPVGLRMGEREVTREKVRNVMNLLVYDFYGLHKDLQVNI